MAAKKKGKGKKGQRKKMAPSGPNPAGQLAYLKQAMSFIAWKQADFFIKHAQQIDQMAGGFPEPPRFEVAPPPPAAPEDLRDWAGLPQDLLAKVAGTLVAQTEAGWAAHLKEAGYTWEIKYHMEERKRNGNCPLFVFALVCKGWRKAQLKVGGPLRTRVGSDVLLPGRVALAKWALAEGCPRELGNGYSMAMVAAEYGHLELVKWLSGEGGCAMDEWVMRYASKSGNLELVRWLWRKGCPWDCKTCYWAVYHGHVEVLRWARENGCPWTAFNRDRAARELGYTDDLGNLVDEPPGLGFEAI